MGGVSVNSLSQQEHLKKMQKYHRVVPCDTSRIFQVFGGYTINKLKFNILFNEYPDLAVGLVKDCVFMRLY